MSTNIGFKSVSSESAANTLIGILADEFILYLRIRRAHRNVHGSQIASLRKMFEDHCERIGRIIGDVTERICAIGCHVPTTFREHLQRNHLTGQSNPVSDDKDLLRDLLDSHENVIMHLRKHINIGDQKLHDLGFSDFIARLMIIHEKLVWVLISHLID